VRAGREGRSDRIALRLRELTQRALFRFLQQELRHAVVATLLRERPCMTALPGPMELSEVSLPSDPVLRASLRAMERGGLRDLVRGENALVPRFELERIYRRTQRRRHRFVRALRRQAAVDALLCAVAQGSAP
jgi:hypothetical protein